MTVGHRLDPWMPSVTAKLKAHAAKFKKFPPKDIGLRHETPVVLSI